MRVETNLIHGADRYGTTKRGKIIHVHNSTKAIRGKGYSTFITVDIKYDDETTETRVKKEDVRPLKKAPRRSRFGEGGSSAQNHRNNPDKLNGQRCEVYYPETKILPIAYHLYQEEVQLYPEDMRMYRLERSFREMIIRRCTVEQDIDALEQGREEANEEVRTNGGASRRRWPWRWKRRI
jgi:hypothetical protein